LYICHELFSRHNIIKQYAMCSKKFKYIDVYIHVVIAMIIFRFSKSFSLRQWTIVIKKQMFNTIFNFDAYYQFK
jgi:uncharacterized membrane protein